jgi:hypothetical protein
VSRPRPVVERVRVRSRLYALVAGAAAVGIDPTSAQDRERLVELVSLVVVDQVPGLHDRVRPQLVDRHDRRIQDLGRQCLLRPEGRCERRAEPVEPLHACRRLLVSDVRVGELCEDGKRPGRLRARREVGPFDRPFAGPRGEDAAAGAIDIGADERRIRPPAR